jgi:hypothetical protein
MWPPELRFRGPRHVPGPLSPRARRIRPGKVALAVSGRGGVTLMVRVDPAATGTLLGTGVAPTVMRGRTSGAAQAYASTGGQAHTRLRSP